MNKFFCRLISLVTVLCTEAKAQREPNVQESFNSYVLEAVELLSSTRGGLGYGLGAFTHDLQFGDNGTPPASKPPLTMCVAAQLEVLVEALNIYSRETGDFSPFHYIPKVSWERLRPLDLRGQIWIVAHAPSHGGADALVDYGMGERLEFKELSPGSFLNFNRNNGTGHAVIFLSYLASNGAELKEFSPQVAGFKYFSSQGLGHPDGGLGFRWAFFEHAGCPTLSGDRKRDCGIILSENSDLLVGGIVKDPKIWDQKKAAAQVLQSRETSDPRFFVEGEFNSVFFSGTTTDD